MSELYRKYRPTSLKAVVGQDKAVGILKGLLPNLPHCLLFTGPSGCGKTTLARIVANHLDCSDRDFHEINCADFRGIEMIREIRRASQLLPLGGKHTVWLIDECHKLSNDAQNAILKLLEEPPKHVYFLLATTDPHKLLKTVQTRCTEIKVNSLTDDDLSKLVNKVAKKEKLKISEDVVDRLVKAATGSARKALVILQQIMGLEDEEEQIQAIHRAESEQEGIAIARALINPSTRWPDMVKILKETPLDDAENLRRLVLAYASSCLLGNNTRIQSLAYQVIVAFSENFFDTGKAGLIASCYEVVGSRK